MNWFWWFASSRSLVDLISLSIATRSKASFGTSRSMFIKCLASQMASVTRRSMLTCNLWLLWWRTSNGTFKTVETQEQNIWKKNNQDSWNVWWRCFVSGSNLLAHSLPWWTWHIPCTQAWCQMCSYVTNSLMIRLYNRNTFFPSVVDKMLDCFCGVRDRLSINIQFKIQLR